MLRGYTKGKQLCFSWSRPFESQRAICVPLKTVPSKEPKICTFPSYEDKVISKSLQDTGTWEASTMSDFRMLLLLYKDLNVVDLGANLGVYTLTAARLGRKVLAVEPCHKAVNNLHRSVVENKYESQVKLLVNAIEEDTGLYRMKYQQGYISNATAEKVPENEVYLEDLTSLTIVPSLSMDDLLPYIDFKKAILKIDISGNEQDVIINSDRFFKEIDVPFIFMHWQNIHLKMIDGGNVLAYLVRHGYRPKNNLSGDVLDMHDFSSWNNTVIWIKSSLISV